MISWITNFVDNLSENMTGQDKRTFKLDFSGNLWLEAYAILAILLHDLKMCKPKPLEIYSFPLSELFLMAWISKFFEIKPDQN